MADAEDAIDFGARLKRRREERGVALRRIADRTNISIHALEALERNDVSRLPGGIFSRAIVRAYAVEIGADPEIAVREFAERFPHDPITGGRARVHHAVAAAPRRRMVLMIVAALVIAALAMFVRLFA